MIAASQAATPRPVDGVWRAAAYASACLMALTLSYFVYRIPVQLTDSLANLFVVQEATWLQTATAGVGAGYLRPALWLQIKAAFLLAGGAYTPVFRGIHVVQVLACAALFVGALRVRDRVDAAVVPLGLALLFGAHTFDGTVREAFPINTYLTVVVGCLAALNLSFGRAARWRDVAALALLTILLLTVESGAMVFVCLTAAWAGGARGVSGRAVCAAGGLLAAYVVLRFLVLDVGLPGLVERPSGFGFRTLEAQEIASRFGASPLGFYAYNVLAQLMTVLASEPRTGVFAVVRDAAADRMTSGQLLAVATSLGVTALVVWQASRHARDWFRGDLGHDDRLVLVCLAALGANAVVSFPYTKDVIMSPAGALFALAGAASVRALVRRLEEARPAISVACSLLLLALSLGWMIRLVGMHYDLRDASFVTRNEWTEVDDWAARNRVDITRPERAALVHALREDALRRRVPAPAFAQPQLAAYFY